MLQLSRTTAIAVAAANLRHKALGIALAKKIRLLSHFFRFVQIIRPWTVQTRRPQEEAYMSHVDISVGATDPPATSCLLRCAWGRFLTVNECGVNATNFPLLLSA